MSVFAENKKQITVQTYKIKCIWLEIKYATEILELPQSDRGIFPPHSAHAECLTCNLFLLKFEIRFNNISKLISTLKKNILLIITKTNSVTLYKE